MQGYLSKMEEKVQTDQNMLQDLQGKLKKAATKLQKVWRGYWLRKRFQAAVKVQRFWRKIRQKLLYQKVVLEKCKLILMGLKINYFVTKRIKPTTKK